ncbi:protein of unknown function [uncultured Sphingopyxis sp.]|uniref:Uncharacterized protein n=1 Tax=uncultured Sphingopyxis sp. TaxID=310581 RepID=A0A1Y5PML1_9SPHN|nr:protein of unknown function [uncultured Sphingopyxis sp.]
MPIARSCRLLAVERGNVWIRPGAALYIVIPAKAGTQSARRPIPHWVPAEALRAVCDSAGMTNVGNGLSPLQCRTRPRSPISP